MDLDYFLAEVAKSTQHKCFYHFTDVRNLPSIKTHGLLSMHELISRKIAVEAPGGNEWSLEADDHRGLNKYVHLCMFDDHPMEYQARNRGHIGQTKFLKINPYIIKTAGSLMTDRVSNKSDAIPEPSVAMLSKLDLEVIYTRKDWKDPEIKARLQNARKYELLIPNSIPLDMIMNIS